jgi:putative sigma-54 modulation protein
MKVSVHAVNFTVDKKLVDFVQDRMDKLKSTMIKWYQQMFFLKVEKQVIRKQNCRSKINVPGDDFS